MTAFTSVGQNELRDPVLGTRDPLTFNRSHAQTIIPLVMPAIGSAAAPDWKFEGGATPIAYADNKDAQFQFACRGRDLTMAYWVRKPDAMIAAAPSISLAMKATGGTFCHKRYWFYSIFSMIHHDGSSVLIREPVARQWARNAQQARDSIELAFVETETSGGLEFRDRQRFDAKGSSAAKAKVLADCH